MPSLDKQHILNEIKRTAEVNGGVALGRERFQKETGIKQSDWYGKYWIKWNDVIEEAGYSPNSWGSSYDEAHLIQQLIEFIREIKHFPIQAELKMKARNDKSFPNEKTFFDRFGGKANLASKVIEYCREHSGYDDVIEICESLDVKLKNSINTIETEEVDFGYVYLIKSGRFYKIGRSKSVGRREYELSIQLPEKTSKIHTIATDDPVGIEAYWHKRFESKRKNGEWFELTQEDIKAFKRRKFM